MYTLLPTAEIKTLKREYLLRFIILMIFFVSGAVWIGIVSLFPSYIISITQEKSALTQASKIEGVRQAAGSEAINAQVAYSNTLTNTLTQVQDSLSFPSLIEDIAAHKTQGIIINSFELSHTSNGPTQSIIVIRGRAVDRDALSTFKKKLEGDTRISKVELPFSNFTLNKDINFSIGMQGLD